MPGQHHSNVSVTDDAVHLGNSNNFTLDDARDAIYRSTLTDTLRSMAYNDSLRGFLVKIPFAASLTTSLKRDLDGKIASLEAHLKRVQAIEQRHANSAEAREFFASALNDSQVGQHMVMARSHAARLLIDAQSMCTSKDQAACMNDLCDQVQRVEKQMAARMSLEQVIGDIPAEDIPDIENDTAKPLSSEYSDMLTATVSPSQPFRDASNEQQEYLYATQEFWRQLASTLESLGRFGRQSWIYAGKKAAFYTTIFTFIYMLEDLTTGFMVHDPEEKHLFLVFFKLVMSFVVTYLISSMVSATSKRWKSRERSTRLSNV